MLNRRNLNVFEAVSQQVSITTQELLGTSPRAQGFWEILLLARQQYRQLWSGSKFPLSSLAYCVKIFRKRLDFWWYQRSNGNKCRDDTTKIPYIHSVRKHYTLQKVRCDSNYDRRAVHSEIIPVKYLGPWQMVDNGYVRVPTAIPPLRNAVTFEKLHWAQWLESMQKDAKCALGLMKVQRKSLKTAIRYEFGECQ